jgi:hypothetical protein
MRRVTQGLIPGRYMKSPGTAQTETDGGWNSCETQDSALLFMGKIPQGDFTQRYHPESDETPGHDDTARRDRRGMRVGAGGPSPAVCARTRLEGVTPLGRSISDSVIQVKGSICSAGEQISRVPISDQRLNPSCSPVEEFASRVCAFRQLGDRRYLIPIGCNTWLRVCVRLRAADRERAWGE